MRETGRRVVTRDGGWDVLRPPSGSRVVFVGDRCLCKVGRRRSGRSHPRLHGEDESLFGDDYDDDDDDSNDDEDENDNEEETSRRTMVVVGMEATRT